MRAIVSALGMFAIGVAGAVACANLDNLSGAPPRVGDDAGEDSAVPSTHDAGTDAAAPPCSSDLENDAKHCGRCGHDCLGGTCAKGACQPVQLISERSNPVGLVIDGTHAYYFESARDVVARVPKAGGTAQPVCFGLTGTPQPFTVDDTSIYCSVTTGIVRFPKVGGLTETLILSGTRSSSVLFADATSVFGLGSTSFSVAKGGGAAVALPIQTQNTGPATAAHDATKLYANHFPSGIYASAKTNTDAAGVTLFVDAPEASGIALDSAYAYVTARLTGTVKRAPKAGGPAISIVAGVNSPRVIAVDDATVFFGTGDGDILACPRDGCTAAPRVVAEKQGDLYGIAVDATAVYWTSRTNGTVMRVAK